MDQHGKDLLSLAFETRDYLIVCPGDPTWVGIFRHNDLWMFCIACG